MEHGEGIFGAVETLAGCVEGNTSADSCANRDPHARHLTGPTRAKLDFPRITTQRQGFLNRKLSYPHDLTLEHRTLSSALKLESFAIPRVQNVR